MTLAQLEHGIRASCQLLGTQEVYVVGSQSILASYPALSGPMAKSNEMDVLPILQVVNSSAPEIQQQAADVLNGSIGEGSTFMATHGFEVEGVVENDLVLPLGWRTRTIPLKSANTNGYTGHCLDPYDMAAAKIAAGRDKDKVAIVNLIRQGIIKPEKLKDRVLTLTDDQIFDRHTVADLIARLDRWNKLSLKPEPTRKKPGDSSNPGNLD